MLLLVVSSFHLQGFGAIQKMMEEALAQKNKLSKFMKKLSAESGVAEKCCCLHLRNMSPLPCHLSELCVIHTFCGYKGDAEDEGC